MQSGWLLFKWPGFEKYLNSKAKESQDLRRNFNYEGSHSGKYRFFTQSANNFGIMEKWIGNSDMPKQISVWQSRPKEYHIIFRNRNGFDNIHLRYNKKEADILLNKYHNLFPQLKRSK